MNVREHIAPSDWLWKWNYDCSSGGKPTVFGAVEE